MDRSRRPRSGGRFRVEGLEARALLSAGADLEAVSSPTSEVVPLSTTDATDTLELASQSGVVKTRGPAALMAVRRRAERMAARWEQSDASGPRITDTTLLTRGDQIVGFSLTFDSPMRADAATDPNAYRAIRITKPNAWLSRLTYQSDGPEVEELRIKSVEYHDSSRAAVIWLQDPRRATGKFRVGVVTKETRSQRRLRPMALGPLTDLNGHVVRHNPADVRLPGRYVLFTQPDHSMPFDSPRLSQD